MIESRFRPYRGLMGDGMRTQSDVINDLLVCCRSGQGKTRAMYDCNLNSKQIQDYFQHLIKFDLLKAETSDFSARPVYRTTGKGKRFVKLYSEILSIFAPIPEVKAP